jgi:triosephosphate isomerase (TIM)
MRAPDTWSDEQSSGYREFQRPEPVAGSEAVMHSGLRIPPPIFEIGLKGYCFGAEAVQLAVAADRASVETGVTVIFDPQAVDIPAVAAATTRLLVFAQHMDPVTVGRGAGAVLPEALRAAGAVGVMLNHSERRMTLADLRHAIIRADEVGLATMACSDSPDEAVAIANLHPDIVLAEPPALIGGDRPVGAEMGEFVRETIARVAAVDPAIIVMCSAGIRSAADVAAMVELGVAATGSTSGILTAPDPLATMRSMVDAMADAWRRRHPS